MREARLLPCSCTGWHPGRWRPVAEVLRTVDSNLHETAPEGCILASAGGGVPIGCDTVWYADAPRWASDHRYDYAHNLEFRVVGE